LKEAERQKRSVPPADIDKRFKQLQARWMLNPLFITSSCCPSFSFIFLSLRPHRAF